MFMGLAIPDCFQAVRQWTALPNSQHRRQCHQGMSGRVPDKLISGRGSPGSDGNRRPVRQAGLDCFRQQHRVHLTCQAGLVQGHGIDWRFITAGKLIQNAFVESFRASAGNPRQTARRDLVDDNGDRAHSSLNTPLGRPTQPRSPQRASRASRPAPPTCPCPPALLGLETRFQPPPDKIFRESHFRTMAVFCRRAR
jgi:transposase InsO family protein